MPAGAFDQKLVIEQPAIAADGYGGGVVSWSTFATVWASVKPQSGREDQRQGAERGSCLYQIEAYAKGLESLTAAMRVNWRGTILNIREIRRRSERAPTMIFTAETGVAV